MADTTALKNRIRAAIKANDNQEITGLVLQQALLDMVDELNGATETEASQRQNADSTLQQNINTEAGQRQNADTELNGRITALQGVVNGIVDDINNGYVYAGIATPSTTPVSGKVFYLALTAGTYTNFGSIIVPQGINILKYNGSAWSLDSFLGLDEEPTDGSKNIPESEGTFNAIYNKSRKETLGVTVEGLHRKAINSEGEIVDSNARMCFSDYIDIDDIGMTLSSTNQSNVIVYDSSKTKLSDSGWIDGTRYNKTSLKELFSRYTFKYVRISFRYEDGRYIEPSDFAYVIPDIDAQYIDKLWADYEFGGVISTSDSYVNTGKKVMYIASKKGTYTNYGNISVDYGEVAVILCNGTNFTKQIVIADRIIGTKYGTLFSKDEVEPGSIIYGTLTPEIDRGTLRVKYNDDSNAIIAGWSSGDHTWENQDFYYILPDNYKEIYVANKKLVINGNIVRRQYANLFQNLTNIDDSFKAFFNINIKRYIGDADFMSKNVINRSGVLATASANYDATVDFIPVSPGDKIKLYTSLTNSNAAIAFYSTNNESGFTRSVVGIGTDKLYEFDEMVLSGENYIRITRYHANGGFGVIYKEIADVGEETEVINLADKGVVVSDYANEAMTQCPSPVYGSDGFIYIAYNANPTNKHEGQVQETVVKIAKIPVCNMADTTHVDVLKAGDTVGNFTQSSDIGPYDPQLVLDGDTLKCILVVGIGSTSGVQQLGLRTINKNTLVLGDTVQLLTFTYTYNGQSYTIPIKANEMCVYADRVTGTAEGTHAAVRPIMTQIQYYDGYYYTYLSGNVGSNTSYIGVLVRSLNLVEWEEVSCPLRYTIDYGIDNVTEASILINDGVVYVCFRNPTYPIGIYNLQTGVWGDITTNIIPAGNRQRPYLFKKGNYLYTLTTGTPEYKDKNDRTIIRTNLTLVKFDFNLLEIERKTLLSVFGLVYPIMVNASEGYYIVCAENRRWDYDTSIVTYPCSDIVVVIADFMNTL